MTAQNTTDNKAPVFAPAIEFGKKTSRDSEPRSAGWQAVMMFMKGKETAAAVRQLTDKNGKAVTDVDQIYSYLTHAAKEFNKRNSPAGTSEKYIEVKKGIPMGSQTKEVQLRRLKNPASFVPVETAAKDTTAENAPEKTDKKRK